MKNNPDTPDLSWVYFSLAIIIILGWTALGSLGILAELVEWLKTL